MPPGIIGCGPAVERPFGPKIQPLSQGGPSPQGIDASESFAHMRADIEDNRKELGTEYNIPGFAVKQPRPVPYFMVSSSAKHKRGRRMLSDAWLLRKVLFWRSTNSASQNAYPHLRMAALQDAQGHSRMGSHPRTAADISEWEGILGRPQASQNGLAIPERPGSSQDDSIAEWHNPSWDGTHPGMVGGIPEWTHCRRRWASRDGTHPRRVAATLEWRHYTTPPPILGCRGHSRMHPPILG